MKTAAVTPGPDNGLLRVRKRRKAVEDPLCCSGVEPTDPAVQEFYEPYG